MTKFATSNQNRDRERLQERPIATIEMQMTTSAKNNSALAALLTVLASAFAAGATLLAKSLGTDVLGTPIHALQIAHGRFLFALMIICCHLALFRPEFSRPNLPLHATRSGFGWAGISLMFAAAAFIPLADATAISFMNPVFAMMLAIPLLGERVGPIRWSAAFIALAGAMVLSRVWQGSFELGAFLALGSAIMFGAEVTLIKILSRREKPLQILFFNNLIGVLIASVAVMCFWQWPNASQWAALAGVGLLILAAQTCFVNALVRADASFVTPFFFFALVFATLYDSVFFGVVPQTVSIVGAVLIIAGAGLLAWREANLSKHHDGP